MLILLTILLSGAAWYFTVYVISLNEMQGIDFKPWTPKEKQLVPYCLGLIIIIWGILTALLTKFLSSDEIRDIFEADKEITSIITDDEKPFFTRSHNE